MKKVYCIALEGSGITGADWYCYRENRDSAKGTTGAEIEVAFDCVVSDDATDDEITDTVDYMAWTKNYTPITEYKPEKLIA